MDTRARDQHRHGPENIGAASPGTVGGRRRVELENWNRRRLGRENTRSTDGCVYKNITVFSLTVSDADIYKGRNVRIKIDIYNQF